MCEIQGSLLRIHKSVFGVGKQDNDGKNDKESEKLSQGD